MSDMETRLRTEESRQVGGVEGVSVPVNGAVGLTKKQIEDIENVLACTDDPDVTHCDNLAIMLCSYYSRHLDRPEDDEENEDNHNWGVWVIGREKAMRKAITAAAIKAVTKAFAPTITALQEKLREAERALAVAGGTLIKLDATNARLSDAEMTARDRAESAERKMGELRTALTEAAETLEWLALHSPDCYGWEGHEDPDGPWPSIQTHAFAARKALTASSLLSGVPTASGDGD